MKAKPKQLKPILNMMVLVFFALFSIVTTQTSAIAVPPQIDAGGYNTVGLKSDGTAVATGANKYGQRDVENWTDVVQVTVGVGHTVGLRSDGTAMAVGYNAQGQCEVYSWIDIVQVTTLLLAMGAMILFWVEMVTIPCWEIQEMTY